MCIIMITIIIMTMKTITMTIIMIMKTMTTIMRMVHIITTAACMILSIS